MADSAQYWFNSKTKEVEKGFMSSSLDRIGPFNTEREAANAEETLRLRAAAWLEEDKLED